MLDTYKSKLFIWLSYPYSQSIHILLEDTPSDEEDAEKVEEDKEKMATQGYPD